MAKDKTTTSETLRTRAQIVGGRDHETDVRIEKWDMIVKIRQLTDWQASDVEATLMDGQHSTDLDIGLFARNEFLADAKAVAYGLVLDPALTVEEVKELRPAGVVKEVAAAIYEASGMTPSTEAEVLAFRDEHGRGGDGEADREDAPPAAE